jgi:hypothetical protein
MGMGVKHYYKDGKEHKGGYHKMPDGSLHSGAKHTKSSKPLFHYGDLPQKSKRTAREGWK